jgi:hypothetical protein
VRIIGFAGKMGVGKTTLAGYLSPYRVSFADALKEEVAEQFGIPVRWCYDQKDVVVALPDGSECVLRKALQEHGAKRRAENTLYWVAEVDEALRLLEWSSPDIVCIDDVRYINEAEYLKDRGAKLVYVCPYLGWAPGTHSNHPSETELDGYGGFDAILSPRYGHLAEEARDLRHLIAGGQL